MWTISDQQIEEISSAMKKQFKEEMFFHFKAQKKCIDSYSYEQIRDVIDVQIDFAETNRLHRNLCKGFLDLSFTYPIMLDEDFKINLCESLEYMLENQNFLEDLELYVKEYINEYE